MKRLIALVLILLFPSLSFATTKEWYNSPQYLTKIPKTNLGTAVLTRPGSGNALPMVVSMASNNSASVDIAAGILSVPLYAYSPIAGMAGQYVLGKGLQAAVDLAGTYADGTLESNPTFKSLVDQTLNIPESPSVGDTVDSQTFSCLSSKKKISGISTSSFDSDTLPDDTCGEWQATKYYIISTPGSNPIHAYRIGLLRYNFSLSTDPVSYPVEKPSQLSPTLLSQLAQRIASEIAANTETMKDAISDLLKNNPNLIPETPQITNYDIQNTANQDIYDNRQESIDYYTNKYNEAVTNNNTELSNYYQDKIQEEQARQEEEQAKETKEESFSPISDNPFDEPYSPGA